MKIGIVGYGYVGKGMHRLFGDHIAGIYDPNCVEVQDMETDRISYQPYEMSWSSGNKYKKLDNKKDFENINLAIICVPTPQKKDGSCDTSIVEETVAWLETPLILIKSTIPPGTTDRLIKEWGKKIAFSPEYMGEGSYFVPPWKYPDPKEVKKHTFQIFGGEKETTKQMVDIFQKVMGPHVFYAQTDAKTAEVVKYFENSWGAMKVIFANEWFDICKAHGVDYREARELWALDSRVEKMHTAVFTDKRGYGGKCFPKDVSAIIKATKDKGYVPKLMKMVVERNKEFNKLNKKE